MAGSCSLLLFVALHVAVSAAFSVDLGLDDPLGLVGRPLQHAEISEAVSMDEVIAIIKKTADQIMEKKLQRTREIYKLEDPQEHHGRSKRAIPDQLSKAYKPFYELISIQSLPNAIIPGCTDAESFSLGDDQYIVATNVSSTEQTVLYSYNNGTSTVLQVMETADVKDLAVFQVEGKTVLIVMESNSYTAGLPTGSVVYEFDNTTQNFQYVQRILTNNPQSMEVFSQNGLQYVIFAGAFVETVDAVQRRVSAIHRWRGGHLDNIFTLITGNAVDVRPFSIHSHVFLGLANQTDSHILIFRPHLEAFSRYQDIHITHAVNWEYFSLGEGVQGDHFLAVASNKGGPSESIIYKYHHNEFVPFQSIPTTGARLWHAVKNSDGTLRVLALSSDNGITFYEYNGWRFEKSSVLIPQPGGLQAKSMTSFIQDSHIVLVIADNSTLTDNVYELKFRRNRAVQQLHRNASLSCIQLRAEIASLESRLNAVQIAAKNLVYLNSSEVQIITGNKTFLGNISMDTVQANEMHAENGMILDADEKVDFSEVKSNQTQSFSDLTNIETQLNGAVNKTGPQQTVTGQKTFHQMTSQVLDANAVNVESDIINGDVNLTELVTETWHKDQDQAIDVEFSVSRNVTVQGDLTVSEYLDGVNISNVVTLSRNHIIDGNKSFSSPVKMKGNLNVSQNIDGISVDKADLLLTFSNQTIQNHLNVSGNVAFLNNVEVDGLVDGCNLSAINQNAVLTSGNFTITGNKTFTGNLIPESGITMGTGRTIDSVSILQLDKTVLKTTGYQQLTGDYTFSQTVDIHGDLDVDGLVDGLTIPDGILLENSTTQAVLAENWTLYDITVEQITVETSIDGIQRTAGGSGLDVMLVNGGAQTIDGAITFAGGIRLNSTSQVTGLVDGVDVSSLAADAVYKTGNQQITGEKTFASGLSFQQDLQVEELVNEINITAYESNAVKLFDDDNTVVFNGDVVLNASETKMAGPLITAGNHSFPYKRSLEDLVIQDQQDTIYGLKTFPQVSSDQDVEATLVNGINVSDYFNDSIRVIPGVVLVIDDNVTFWDDVTMNANLTIESQIIDDIYIPDIVTITDDSTVSSTFTNDVTAHNLSVTNLTLSGLLNGYDIQTVNEDTLKKNQAETQIVSGLKTFLNGMTISGDLVVRGNTVGVDLSTIAADTVYVNHAHTVITAGKTFAFADITHLNATDHIDGVHLPSFSKDVVLQAIAQTIEGAVTFNQNVDFDADITVAKTINGHNVSTWLLAVLDTLSNSYNEELEFSDIVSDDNVTIDGLIDGHKMADFVLNVAELQVVCGAKLFTGNVIVNETIEALLVNGVAVDVLSVLAVLHTETENIDGNKTFARGISLQQNMTVTTLVDTVDVPLLKANSFATINENKTRQIVLGNGTLGNVIVRGNLTSNSTLYGIDPEQLEKTYISLTLPQTVTGYKTLQDTLTIATPAVLDATTIYLEGELNEVNLETFAASHWLGGDSVSGVKTFTQNTTLRSSLTIGGTINGLDIDSNAMVTDQSSTVTGIKTFTGSPLSVTGAINMTDWKEVDGVDLSEYEKKAVTINKDHNITLPTGIAGITLQKNFKVEGTIDGINVSANNLLMINGTQEVSGVKTFTQDVSISPNILITALLNGVDLVDLFENTLLISPNQTILGHYTFNTELVLSNVTTLPDVHIGGLRIPELYRLVHTYPTFDEFNRSLQLRCDMLNKMHQAQENAAVLLLHLSINQVIDTIGHHSWHAVYFNDTQWLIQAQTTTYPATNCIGSDIYHWNQTSDQYEYFQTIYPKSAVDIDSFILNDRLFLVLASKNNDTGECDNFTRLGEGDDVDGILTLNRSTIPSNLYSYSTTNVIVWHPDSQAFYLYQALPCVSPSDVEVFIDPLTNQTCIAIANELHIDENLDFITVLPSYVYCLQSLSTGFFLNDTFTTACTRRIKPFFKNSTLHLAVANHLNHITQSFTTESVILKQASNGSFLQVATIEGNAATDILPMIIEGTCYIILANEFTGVLNRADYDVPIYVYKYSGTSTMKLEQELSAFGAVALASYTSSDKTFIVVIDQTEVSVYKFQGVDIFVKVHTLDIRGATSFHVFPLADTGRMQGALAVSDEEERFFENVESAAVTAPSLILDFVKMGEILSTIACDIY